MVHLQSTVVNFQCLKSESVIQCWCSFTCALICECMQGPTSEEVGTVVNFERLQWEESQQENGFWHDSMVMGFQVCSCR